MLFLRLVSSSSYFGLSSDLMFWLIFCMTRLMRLGLLEADDAATTAGGDRSSLNAVDSCFLNWPPPNVVRHLLTISTRLSSLNSVFPKVTLTSTIAVLTALWAASSCRLNSVLARFRLLLMSSTPLRCKSSWISPDRLAASAVTYRKISLRVNMTPPRCITSVMSSN